MKEPESATANTTDKPLTQLITRKNFSNVNVFELTILTPMLISPEKDFLPIGIATAW